MITLNVNGIEYDNFLSFDVSKSMINFSNEAEFTMAFDISNKIGKFTIPFLGNERCEVFIDGTKVITGFIDNVQISYDNNKHTVSYSVRDKTVDFADSSIDVINEISGSLSLEKIIKIVLKHLGLELGGQLGDNGIDVINKVDGLKPFDSTVDNISPEVGENAFDFCSKLCKKRQVLMTTDADGNIEIIRNSGEIYDVGIQNAFSDDNDANNIINANYSYTFANSFRNYIVKSQVSSSSGGLVFGDVSDEDASDQVGKQTDERVRVGRQKVIVTDESSSSKDNQERATWQANFQRAESFKYSILTNGFSLGEELIIPNKKVYVRDDFVEFDGVMLIEDVNYTYDVSGGSRSSIVLTEEGAFTLTLTEPEEQDKEKSNSGLLDFSGE